MQKTSVTTVLAAGLIQMSSPFAVTHRRILVTRDVGIADITRFPAGSSSGVVLVRFPQAIRTHDLNTAILAALSELPPDRLVGAIAVIEPGRVRVRRRSS